MSTLLPSKSLSQYYLIGFWAFFALFFSATSTSAALQFLDDEAEPQFNVAFQLKPSKTGRFTLVFNYQDAQNFYALDCVSGAIRLRAMKDGKTEALGQSTFDWQNNSKITLKRRPWLMQVIVNDAVALTAYDAAFDFGQIGTIVEGGWEWSESRVQPVDEVYFADDFTREEGESGDWTTLAGKWSLTASSENINTSNSAQSSNPFSYQVKASDVEAKVTAGRWFWDNYEAQVSVRPEGRGEVGLAAYVQDGGRDYLAFVWSAEEGPSARRLIRVRDGKAQTLVQSPGAFLPRQWYRLGIRTSPGYVEAFVDGVAVFRVRDESFGQGGIGLIARRVMANFDDAKVRSYDYYRQDFAGAGALAAGGAWQPREGIWNTQNETVTSAAVPGDGGRTRVLLAGRDEWSGYQMGAAVRVGESGGGGLVSGYQDGLNYIAFRWAGAKSTLPFKGRQQLLRYHNGKATIVSDEPASIFAKADKDGWARVTMRYAEGALTVYAGQEIIAQTADETLASGRAGFYAQGTAPVNFRDVVMFFPPEPDRPKVAPKMEDDSYMVGWASPSGEWPPTAKVGGTEHWNTGEFFGDARIEYAWLPKTDKNGKVEIALDAETGDFNSGYVVRVQGGGAENGKAASLRLAIARGEQILRETEWKPGTGDEADLPDEVLLQVEREGRSLLVLADGKPALSYVPTVGEAEPYGTRVAARAVGAKLRTDELIAFSANRDDYTFTQAPTDWYAPQGSWSVFSRWPCFSNWSFFGGQGLAPALWSKRTYGGDVVVEMYAHNQMDLPKELGYSHAGDLNITLGGDGKDLASGYSFVVAGWANTRSAILKNSQVVAENDGEKARFNKPINHNSNYHKRWFYIRAEARRAAKDGKQGVMVRLSLDNELLAEYFDAQPLPTLNAGRVAFWSNDGTIMIARAKIEAEKMGPRALPSGLLDAQAPLPTMRSAANSLAPLPVAVDSLPSAIVEAADGDEEWIVRNPAGGGHFAVELRRPTEYGSKQSTPWLVKPGNRITMQLLLPDEAKIDLYAEVDGRLHLIELTGNQRRDARALPLGAAFDNLPVASTSGAAWREVNFDIGAALQKQYPQAREWEITSLQLGALHGEPYRWNGFYGNPLGTTYRLRNARVL